MQGSCADRGAAAVAVGTGKNQGAGPSLGQRASAAQVAGIGARCGLVESDSSIVGDVALQAGGITLQYSGTDRGAATVTVRARKNQGAGASLGHCAIAAQVAGIGARHSLVESDSSIVGDDVALQAGSITLQNSGTDRGPTAVAVSTGKNQGAHSGLG